MTTATAKTDRRVYTSTHIFNFRLFLEGIKRLRIFAIAVAILSLTASALIPIVCWIEQDQYRQYTFYSTEIEKLSPSVACIPAAILVLIAPFLAADLFSFLHKRKESDFFHAIPYTRSCVFVSFVAAILAVTAAILAGCGLVSGILWTLCPYYTVPIGGLIVHLLLCFLAAAMLTGFMLLSHVVTGTSGTAASLYLLFASFVRLIAAILLGMMSLIQVIDNDTLWETSPLSPLWSLPVAILVNLFDEAATKLPYTPANVIYSVVITLALLARSGLLYTRRHSEMAGNSAPGPKTQALFRILFTLPLACLIPLLIWLGFDFSAILIVTVATVLLYLLYELVTTRRARNMLRALPGLAIVAAATLLFTGVFFATRSAILHEDIRAEDMKSVTISYRWQNSHTSGILRLDGQSIDDPAVLAVIAECLADSQAAELDEGQYVTFPAQMYVDIRLHSGRTLHRYIGLTSESFHALCTALSAGSTDTNGVLSLPGLSAIDWMYIQANDPLEHHYNVSYHDDYPAFREIYGVLSKEYAMLTPSQKLDVATLNPDYPEIPTDQLRFTLCFEGHDRSPTSDRNYSFTNYYVIDPTLFPETYKTMLVYWVRHDELQRYPINEQLHSTTAILTDIADYFDEDSHRPTVSSFVVPASYNTQLTVYRADGSLAFEDQNTISHSRLPVIAECLSESLTFSSSTAPAAVTLTDMTYIVHLSFDPHDDNDRSVSLWLACDLTSEDIEALRKALW